MPTLFFSHDCSFICIWDLIFYSIKALQCQHWRSTTTCAVALELPNLNYVHEEPTLELKLLIYLAGIFMPSTRVCLLEWYISTKKKTPIWWTRFCLLIYLWKTPDTVILWTRVCLLEWCIYIKKRPEYVSWSN